MSEFKILFAKDIKTELDKKIIGQEDVKKHLAVLGFLHSHRPVFDKFQLKKKEVLLILGPTGTGKTYSVKALADFLKLPFIHVTATELTPSGYVGQTLADLLNKHRKKPDFERAIVFIDEFDKITLHKDNRDAWYQTIQASILTAVEGAEVHNDSRSSAESFKAIDTSKMLFILGGAFETLIANRNSADKPYGGIRTSEAKSKLLTTRAWLAKSGILKELVGRITAITETHHLSDQMYKDILFNKYGILKEYDIILEEFGARVELDESDVQELITEAKELKIGGRAVDAFVFRKLMDTFYDLEEHPDEDL